MGRRILMKRSKSKTICGVTAVALCTVVACFWSVWGTIENFHEGWYQRTTLENLLLSVVQYVGWPIGFALLAVVGIWQPRLGAILFVSIGILLNAFLFGFRNAVGIQWILVPCLLIGMLFGLGDVPYRRWATGIVVGLPMAIILGIGIPLMWKVSHRLTEISNNSLFWKSGDVTLVWAPPGPGWPQSGVEHRQAEYISDHLTLDGRSLSKQPLHLWRLPTVDEAVLALNRGGKPAGCVFGGKPGFQPCKTEPDKEAPLWDPFSQVIYWWTGTDDAKGKNLRVAYNGYVLPVSKRATGDTGFRAVMR